MSTVQRVTFVGFILVLLVGLPALDSAQGYPNGPQIYVTDLAPACASCHSSTSPDEMRNLPAAFAAKRLLDTKHYRAILAGFGGYKDLTKAERERLVEDVKVVDANASVVLEAPRSAARGERISVTVTVTGGAGPVVGVMLLDSDLRYQARPIAADGWTVVGAPTVRGPGGAQQTKWVNSRAEGLRKNLSFVLIYGVKSDLAAKSFAQAKITWTLRAPQDAGEYAIAAAFLYGTEKASALGAVPKVGGGFLPRGGGAAPSGRIKFSVVTTVRVN